MPWIKHLVGCPLFDGLAEDDIAVFRQVTKQVHYNAESTIMTEGEEGEDLLVLIDGQVTISKALTLLAEDEQSTTDKTFITLDAKIKPFFGEMALVMEDSRRTATVKAATDCEIVIMDKEGFLRVCEEHPRIAFKVMLNIGKKLAANLNRESQNVLKLTTAFSLVLEE